MHFYFPKCLTKELYEAKILHTTHSCMDMKNRKLRGEYQIISIGKSYFMTRKSQSLTLAYFMTPSE